MHKYQSGGEHCFVFVVCDCSRYNSSLLVSKLGQTLGLVMATRGAGMCRNARHRCANSPVTTPSSSSLTHQTILITNTPPAVAYKCHFTQTSFFGPHKTTRSTYLTSDQIFSILRESQSAEGFPGKQTHDFIRHKPQHYAIQQDNIRMSFT